MTEISLTARESLEAIGAEVFYDYTKLSEYNTEVFIRYNGSVYPYYTSLSEIPVLPNGTQFMLDRNAIPSDIRDWNRVEAYLHNIGYTGLETSELFPIPPWWLIGLIIATVLTAIVLIGVYNIVKAQDTRCGTTAKIQEISDCIKVIIAPDCSVRSFDSCNNQWKDDQWQPPQPPTPPSVDFIKWAVIGILAIGGTYLMVKLTPVLVEKLKLKTTKS